MKKFKRKPKPEEESASATPAKKIISQTKKMSKRDYFAGEALFSLVVRNEACNFSVEAYYVADHMLSKTTDEEWSSEVGLKDYFASKFISGVIQAKLDRKYSPEDAFKVASEMIESRERLKL
jgi:hypothetical protein